MASPDPRAEDTRSRLIAAGLELFGRYGFDAVTTRQLTDAAGVNQAAIPYHFGGKDGLYRAVAEHIAATTSAQLQPILSDIRRRLAAEPGREEIEAILLDVTSAIARVIYAPEHRTAWLSFLSREQFHPTVAFDHLYTAFAGPLHELVGDLVGRLAGAPADAVENILLTQAYLGPIIGFASARATLNRRLGREGDLGPENLEEVIAAIRRFSRMAIRGMRG